MTKQEKEFEDLELVINRNEKWLKPHEKRGFFLSDKLYIQSFKLPKELDYLTEDDIPLLRAIVKLHWERFIVNLMKDLRERSIKHGKEE